MARVPTFMMVLCGALGLASACEASKPAPTEADASQAKPDPSQARPDASAKSEGPSRTPAVVTHSESKGPAAADSPPAWFDAAKIEHTAIVNQMESEGTIAGGRASALILELAPGTSTEQCMAMARTALGESLTQVPEATSSPDARLTLQGKTADYHYTVVCGEAKGKPTMYLSYTTQ